jgi:GT2 family glycosyltransferase
MSDAPDLSVVVALISGRVDDLRTCLESLREQESALDREVLVPFDEAVASVAELKQDFPEVEFIPAEKERPVAARGGMVREHHDTLRTVGIERARGRVVALTEDHAHVSKDWCGAMVSALEQFPEAAAVGGAVDCDSRSLLNWAVYFGDFGRYQSPVPAGRADFVSDANVAYRREALERVADGWKADFHETQVHGALAREGWVLALTPEGLAWQRRGELDLWTALCERFVWGKSYAGSRCHDLATAKRGMYALFSPVIPLLFTWRGWKMASSRGRAGRFVTALPIFLLLQCSWALGELTGYVVGRP